MAIEQLIGQLPLEHCDLNIDHPEDIQLAASSEGTMLSAMYSPSSTYWALHVSRSGNHRRKLPLIEVD